MITPINAEAGDWYHGADGYYFGCVDIFVTARDMAKFGLLYPNDGEYEGYQVQPADWISESLQRYPEGFRSSYGSFRDRGYGYQWWSARTGDRYLNFASGHGGNYIVLLMSSK